MRLSSKSWYRGPARFRLHRIVDIVTAGLGVVITAPIVGAAALWVRLTSPGGAFFLQERIGLDNKPFHVIKLRTMRVLDVGVDGWSSVTIDGDSRMTIAGDVLRRYKVDELPQLVNVVRGEMSLVGPRPDVSGFVDGLTGADSVVSTVRPGITGPATLLFRDEQAMLASVEDAEAFNRDVLFRAKTAVNVAWIAYGSLWDDFRVVLWTVFSGGREALPELVKGWSSAAESAVNSVSWGDRSNSREE